MLCRSLRSLLASRTQRLAPAAASLPPKHRLPRHELRTVVQGMGVHVVNLPSYGPLLFLSPALKHCQPPPPPPRRQG